MPLTLNIVAKDRGWLFADLQRHYASASTATRRVVASESPLTDADAWVYLRPEEARLAPDLSRTVIQLHDLYGDNPAGRYQAVRDCAGLVVLHPAQLGILTDLCVPLAGKRVLERPLGYLSHFTLRSTVKPTGEFVIGWVGRPAQWQGRDIKRALWLPEIMGYLGKVGLRPRLLLVGQGLDTIASQCRGLCAVDYHRRDSLSLSDYPALYAQMDAHLITSAIECLPTCWFESAATGVPAVATPVGWPAIKISHGETGFLGATPYELALALSRLAHQAVAWRRRGPAIRAMVEGYTLESWIAATLDLAEEVANAR